MKKEKSVSVGLLVMLFLIGMVTFSFMATSGQAKTRPAAATEMGAISYSVPSTAQITKITYYLSKFKDKDTVFFEIGLKNISDQPKRFKVMVDIPGGPSSAYYYPRKGKPPVLKPGEEHMQPMPMVIYNKLPESFLLIVKDLNP